MNSTLSVQNTNACCFSFLITVATHVPHWFRKRFFLVRFSFLCAKLSRRSFCTLALRNIRDVSCTDPQVHLQTRRWAHLSSSVKAPDSAKEIAQRLFLNSALQGPQIPALLPVIWASLASSNFGRAAKRPALHLQKDAAREPSVSDHPADSHPRDVPPCRTDRRRDPSCSQALGHPSNAIIQPPTVSQAVLLPSSQWGCGGRRILGCGISIELRALSVVVPRTAACLACRNTQRPWSG